MRLPHWQPLTRLIGPLLALFLTLAVACDRTPRFTSLAIKASDGTWTEARFDNFEEAGDQFTVWVSLKGREAEPWTFDPERQQAWNKKWQPMDLEAETVFGELSDSGADLKALKPIAPPMFRRRGGAGLPSLAYLSSWTWFDQEDAFFVEKRDRYGVVAWIMTKRPGDETLIEPHALLRFVLNPTDRTQRLTHLVLTCYDPARQRDLVVLGRENTDTDWLPIVKGGRIERVCSGK